MLKSLWNKFISFILPEQQSDLEAYIISKNPQSVGDVEFWTAEYDNVRRLRSRDQALFGLKRDC